MTQNIYTSLIIGTGFSGLAMAIKLKEQGIHDFVILEKADDVGGTWRENTYPGAECDIPSALYSYSFEPYPKWEYKWSMQAQILEYIKYVAKKYELYQHIQFKKEMTTATWNEHDQIWTILTKDQKEYTSKTLVTAIGQLHHPSIPAFPGKDSFPGKSFHSAKWDHSISIEGQIVGVIGNAASAVQFIPEIAKSAKQVVVFQRSANWMLPKQDRLYKEWEKSLVRRFPTLLKLYRLRLWLLGGGLFFLMKKGNNFLRKIYARKTIQYIKSNITDPDTIEKLIPKYSFGAKRVLFSDTYYDALAQANVTLVAGGIKEINDSQIISNDGSSHSVDVLIYATGFKSNPFLLGLDIKGKGGISIQEAWKDGHKQYLGMTVHQFPNMFMMYGPNTNLGHNSIILMSEAQAQYIAQCIRIVRDQKCSSIEVKQAIMQNYYEESQNRLEQMIWNTIDDSWYKSPNGTTPNNYPGRTMEYIRKTKQVNVNDFLISNKTT